MSSSFLRLLNRLLPFATPGTPLVQDLLHLAALCLVLYYAPRIQEALQRRGVAETVPAQPTVDAVNVREGHDVRSRAPDENVEGEALIDDSDGVAMPAEQQDGDARLLEDDIPEEGQPGHAHIPNPAANRNVGAKKAKSLARRDQRRAYHEFMRSQGEAQRARDAEGATERDAAMAAEKERRKAAETALEAKKSREREERKAREEKQRLDELNRRELAVSMVREELAAHSMCDLFRVAERVGGDVDEDWVEKVLHAAGILGKRDDAVTMVTSMGWVVRVTEQQMANLYIMAAENEMGDADGKIEMEELGAVLETMLRA